jgi:hypothetical protein
MTNFRSYRQPSDLEAQDEAIKMSGIAHVVMPGINPRPGFEQARVEDLQFWSQVVSEREGNEPYSQLRVYAMYKAPHPCDELAPVAVAGDTIQRPWMIGASDATLTLDQLQLLERLALNLEGELGGIGTRLVRTAMPGQRFPSDHPSAGHGLYDRVTDLYQGHLQARARIAVRQVHATARGYPARSWIFQPLQRVMHFTKTPLKQCLAGRFFIRAFVGCIGMNV